MSLDFRNLAWICALAAAAAITWYVSRTASDSNEVRSTARPQRGYYVDGAVIAGTDENGALLYHIRADHVEEIPDAERVRLTGVEVVYRDAEEVPWHIKASRAQGPLDSEFLDLSGEVVLVSEPRDGGEPLTVETTSLRLEPKAHLVRTADRVRLVVGKTWHVATGMQIHLKDDRIELESNGYGRVTK